MTHAISMMMWMALGIGPAGSPPAEPGPITELSGHGPEAEGPAAPPEAEEAEPVAAAPQATDDESAPGPGTGPVAAPAPAPTPRPTPTLERQKRSWPDRPITYRIEAAMGGGTNVVFHPSYLGFGYDRRLPGFDAAVRVDYRVGEGRVFLGGGVFYRRFASYGSVFDAIDYTDLVVHEPGALLRLAVMAVEGVDPYVELAGAPSISDISLDYTGSSANAVQRRVTGMGSAMGGLMLYLPKRWLPRKGSSRITVGLDAGLGYTFRGNVAVQGDPSVADDAIDTQAAPLGDLVTRGLTWRLGLFMRVM